MLAVTVSAASVQDRDAAVPLLARLRRRCLGRRPADYQRAPKRVIVDVAGPQIRELLEQWLKYRRQ
ncbi:MULTISPECIES: hypothetical protein [Streptomyces]|uniref:hypothetical protein n=1 Tax=Streptomyces TaxID=1883 RepID=UPI0037880A4C